ncbi:MAG: WG repeat-containing protein [Saprospiraceae bacterium]|nr:WG repeat-containing protein [Saprospiraceae bacterium]
MQSNGTLIDANTNIENHQTFTITPRKISTEIEDQKRQLKQHEWFYDATSKKWGLRSLNDGTTHVTPKFDYIEIKKELGFTLVGIKNNNKYKFSQTQYNFEMVYGLVNNDIGRLITPLEFLHIYFYDFDSTSSVARCIFSNGEFGLIDTIGRIVMREATFIGDFKYGKAAIGFGGKLSGTLKSELRIEQLSSFLKKLQTSYYLSSYTEDDQYFDKNAWLTCESCLWGYIDTSGQVVVSPSYDFVRTYEKEIALVYKNKKWGAIDKKGNHFLNCQYGDIQFSTTKDMLVLYDKIMKYGLIDTLGNLVVPIKYDEIDNIGYSLTPVKLNNKWGFVSKNGELSIPPKYEMVNPFNFGFAAVKYNGKWGLIDEQDKVIIPFTYIKMGNFSEKLIWVKNGMNIVT